jgi:prophage tail gpP-like protein
MAHVAVRIAGMDYEGWQSVSVLRNLEAAAATFACSVTERTTDVPMEPWLLRPGAPCSVWLDGTLVLTGYIDSYEPRFDATSHGVELRGRSSTADFVDAAALVTGGQFKQLSLVEIAQRLAAPFGLPVDALAAVGTPLADVQIQQGETCYAVLERLCRMSGLLVCDGPAGSLVLTRVGTRSAVGALIQGENILGASATLDASQRFSEYIVKGQRANTDDRGANGGGPGGTPAAHDAAPTPGGSNDGGPADASVRATIGRIADSFVGRYRPWLVTAETQADDAMCQLRAAWEAQRRAGRALHASVVVAGWRQLGPDDHAGPLWDVNLLVPVVSPFLGIDRVLVTKAVEFRKDEGGATTRLELTLPDAFAGPGQTVPGASTATGGAPGGGSSLWAGGTIGAITQALGGLL